MLIVVRIVLHRLVVVVGIREAHGVVLRTVGQRQVISLVPSGTEDVCPLVVVDRCIGTLRTVKVSNRLAGIVAGTIGVDGGTRRGDAVAVAVYVDVAESGNGLFIVA